LGENAAGFSSIVLNEYQDFKVFKPARKAYYFSSNAIDGALKEAAQINFSKRLRISALLEGYRSEKKYPLALIGSDPNREQMITPNLQLAEGRFPQADKREICMFLSTCSKLDVEVGDSVIIYVTNVDGYMDYDLLTVSGIVEPKKTQYFAGVDMVGYIPLSLAATLKAVEEDVVSEVVFSSDSFLQKALLSRALPEQFKIVDIWNSEDVTLTMRWIYNFMLWLMLILMIGIVLSSIYHNVHLMLIERYKEIGVYLTFGASGWWILRLFLGELTFYLVYCSILGGILSTLLVGAINSVEFYATDANIETFLCSSQFYMPLLANNYGLSFLVLWFVTLLAAISPVLKSINEEVIIKLFGRR